MSTKPLEQNPHTATDRCYFADTLKYALIFLVVYGHFLGPYAGWPNRFSVVYNVIYSFHMPLFIFISGYFSKHINRQRRKEIDMLLYPFVVYQIINILCLQFSCFPWQPKNPFVPFHQNWYILSLFFWRTFTPYCSTFKKPVVLVSTLVLAFAVGFKGFDYFLSFHRTVYWFPVFLFGYYCKDILQLARFLQKYKFAIIPLFVLLIISICLFSLSEDTYRYVWLGFVPGEGHHGDYLILISRMICYIVSALMSLGFMCVLSILCDKWPWINNASRALGGTMLLYLVHFFFIYPINDVIVEPLGRYAPVVTFGISIILFIIFTNKAVVRFFAFTTDMSVAIKKLIGISDFIRRRRN